MVLYRVRVDVEKKSESEIRPRIVLMNNAERELRKIRGNKGPIRDTVKK